ncbi:hypothetical protein D9M71_421590 [compost metagenome]
MGAGSIIVVQMAFIDPLACLLLPGQIGLQAAAIERVLAPGRVTEACVTRVRLVGRVPQHHPPQLPAKRQQMMRGMQRVAQAVAADVAQRGKQVAAAQAEDGVLHVHAGGGERCRSFGRFVFHGNTPSSKPFRHWSLRGLARSHRSSAAPVGAGEPAKRAAPIYPPAAGRGCMTAR